MWSQTPPQPVPSLPYNSSHLSLPPLTFLTLAKHTSGCLLRFLPPKDPPSHTPPLWNAHARPLPSSLYHTCPSEDYSWESPQTQPLECFINSEVCTWP